MVTRRRARPIVMIVVVLAASACGAIVGIEDRTLDPGAGDGGNVVPADSAPKNDGAATPSDAPADSTPTGDASAKPGTTCGITSCTATELCCIHADLSGGGGGSGGPPQVQIQDAKCQTAACTKTSDVTGTLKCDDTPDCAGQKCCVTLRFGATSSNTVDSACAPSCPAGAYQMCADSSECGAGSCQTIFGPYRVCR